MAERVGQRDAQMRALLANVSHDLKTPMTSITGYAQSLDDGTAPASEVPQIGRVIREEAEHVNRLLADLLYLAEIDAGELIRRQEDADLAALLGRCVRRIEPVARAKDVDVDVEVPADIALHSVDAEKLERAFSNVLDNAAKFTPQGGRIQVNASGHDSVAAVEIANTGEPIASDDLPRIFDRFFRSDRARRTSGGSGLGLAIARELIELHGGRIKAANQGAGVTFAIELPTNP
jgi:signal transduction histidine kinase